MTAPGMPPLPLPLPVAQRVPNARGRHDYWDFGETYNVALTPENLYTAPPDQSERIAALEAALGKIDAIRNSIIGAQKVNWSEHIYPLVAALEGAGYHGQEYEVARENLGTLLARIAALENSLAERDRVIEQARVALEDMNNGWKYIRRAHGDLYGVGWDRAEGKADAALRKIEEVRRG